MSAPLSHVAGIPLEEALTALPAVAAVLTLLVARIRASLHARRRDGGHDAGGQR